MKFCQYCGKEMAAEASFCEKCGKSVAQNKSQFKKKGRSTVFFVLAVVSLVLSALSMHLCSTADQKKLTGNGLEAAYKYHDYTSVSQHNQAASQADVFSVLFLGFAIIGLILLVVGIVKKKQEK